MKFSLLKKNKKAAIELSIGTVVIIVLAMSMLILGLVLIRTIFTTAITSVNEIDTGVKDKIQEVFNADRDKRLVLYPDAGIIKLEQGTDDAGFALGIRNKATLEKTYYYVVTFQSKGTCPRDPMKSDGTRDANSFASVFLGNSELISIPPSSIATPRLVRVAIDETAPACTFRLKVTVNEGSATGAVYETGTMDVQILPKS